MLNACNSYVAMCQKKEVKESESLSVMSDSLKPHEQTVAHQAPLSIEFSRQEYRVDCHFLLQGIFLS